MLQDVWPGFGPDFGPDFWPGFGPGFGGPENTVYTSSGTEKIQCTVLPGQRNTVLQYYLLFNFQKFQKAILGTT